MPKNIFKLRHQLKNSKKITKTHLVMTKQTLIYTIALPGLMGGWGSVVLTSTRAEILDEARGPRQAADTSKSAESGNYEAFIVIHRCQLQLMQPQILTYKHDRVTITTSFHSDSQLLLPALQKNTPGHPPIFRRF